MRGRGQGYGRGEMTGERKRRLLLAFSFYIITQLHGLQYLNFSTTWSESTLPSTSLCLWEFFLLSLSRLYKNGIFKRGMHRSSTLYEPCNQHEENKSWVVYISILSIHVQICKKCDFEAKALPSFEQQPHLTLQSPQSPPSDPIAESRCEIFLLVIATIGYVCGEQNVDLLKTPQTIGDPSS